MRHAVLGSTSDFVEFVHDIIRQFLIAYGLVQELQQKNIEYFNFGEIESDSLTYRYLVKNTQGLAWKDLSGQLWNLKSSPQDEAKGFRNIMKICLAIPDNGKNLIIKPLLANRNLSGIRFNKLDMQGFEFSNSKLESTEFIDCNMNEAHFNGCHFRETVISDECSMVGASMVGTVLESIQSSKGTLYDQKEIQRFFYTMTKRPIEEIKGPCQAAINLKKLFEKFTRKGQGYNIPKNFVLGIKCPGGIPCTKLVEAALDNNYIEEYKEHLKIKVNRYIETVQFVNGFKVTDGIRKILNSTCRDTSVGCTHVFS
jgi:hypothetical protein